MYEPLNNFNPGSSFISPVPIPATEPDSGELVYIPVNCEWIPYICGCLTQLQLQATWQYSTQAELLDVWRRVDNLISLITCTVLQTKDQLCGSNNGVTIDDDMPQFRQEGCLFQVQCADGSWTTIYDPTNCIKQLSTNPSPGSQPGPGSCTEYPFTLQGNSKAVLPVLVNPGDTIEIGLQTGAWSGDNGTLWNCPDGSTFILGGCVGSPSTSGTDPVPTAPHMSLIAIIGGTAFAVEPGVFPVPSSVAANSIVQFQANDDDLTDNLGSISFQANVCIAPDDIIGVTYSVGGGPAQVRYGQPFSVASAPTGGVEAFDMTFAVCVKLTILGSAGFVEIGSSGNNLWNLFDCGGTSHPGPLSNSGLPLTSLTPDTPTSRYTPEGLTGHPFTVAMKVERL